jgi:hypothetical protein
MLLSIPILFQLTLKMQVKKLDIKRKVSWAFKIKMEKNTSKTNRHKIKITKKINSKCTVLEALLLPLEFLKPIEL